MDMFKHRVLDIRKSTFESIISQDIVKGIHEEPRTLPTVLLYSERGLQHYDRHSHAPGYYLRHEEIRILKNQAHSIANSIENKSVIVDLGSASLDKVILLLEALEAAEKEVTYFALDLCHKELVSTLESIPVNTFKHVRCAALHGTFDDGLEWMRTCPEIRDLPKCVLFLGSTIGNFSRRNAATFLNQIALKALTRTPSQSSIIVTIDGCKLPTKVLHAYTGDGVGPFTLAGLQYASSILAEETTSTISTFNAEDWVTMSEWNSTLGRYEGSYMPKANDIQLGPPFENITIKKTEKIRFVYSHKYDVNERNALFEGAGLQEVNSWTEGDCDLVPYESGECAHEHRKERRSGFRI
ncbi:4-dimethylallyltryptophan methyltransferase [Penicillium frequentans]|uniref:4-dimethylallyltryptophan N-methyltransferase n=1 Tax=Penicillium frequentans TaxID=3151616 RepID=A0AAD6D5S2_9EURO|nr:4-dimethylallyltryptophan methyltransferase [Penicillium glabrum]